MPRLCVISVVASAVGGLGELVQNGETGWLVPAAAPAQLAHRLRELINDRQKREAMGVAGRQRAIRDFPISHAAHLDALKTAEVHHTMLQMAVSPGVRRLVEAEKLAR